jgi:NAD(P)-dependent dehydrogenase (short-subunit alcohol dehydrogenase family)
MTAWSRGTWLITGTSMGFGRALVEAVLSRGGRVFATSRDPASLGALAASSAGRLSVLRLDLTNPAEIDAAVADIERRTPLDVLVNNAGYGLLGGVEESSDQEVRDQLEVNFFAAEKLMRAVLPGMRARRSGFIVNISSVAGARAFPGSGYYAASKFALEGVSEALAREAGPLGIKVMVVEPGAFATGFFEVSRRTAARRISDYEVVERRRQSEQSRGPRAAGGDPVHGVQAILQAMESETPPLRLALGSPAVQVLREAYQRRSSELEAWAETAASADTPAS